ncbi:hypothetical protein QEG73_10605 [Chitinophagaceae bacterium 26-R-25]|nr:hypothetical protein [Chitinophagaceae bacterium 26-R-25]
MIDAVVDNSQMDIECILTKQGVTYNIPVNAWHTIAMSEDAEVIIAEKSNIHLNDVTYHYLMEMDMRKLKDQILQLVSN